MSEIRADSVAGPDGHSPPGLGNQWMANTIGCFRQLTTNTLFRAKNISSWVDAGSGAIELAMANPYIDIFYVANGNATKDDNNDDGNMHIQCGGTTTRLRMTDEDQITTAYFQSSALVRDTDLVQYRSRGTLA